VHLILRLSLIRWSPYLRPSRLSSLACPIHSTGSIRLNKQSRGDSGRQSAMSSTRSQPSIRTLQRHCWSVTWKDPGHFYLLALAADCGVGFKNEFVKDCHWRSSSHRLGRSMRSRKSSAAREDYAGSGGRVILRRGSIYQ